MIFHHLINLYQLNILQNCRYVKTDSAWKKIANNIASVVYPVGMTKLKTITSNNFK